MPQDRPETEMRRDEQAAVNERGVPIALGGVGLCAGVVAAFASGPASIVSGTVAGVCALAAGAIALRGTSEADRHRLVELEATEAAHEQRLSENETRLVEARRRIDELEAAAAEREQELRLESDATPSSGADTSALTDPESQLFSEAYFRVALDARIASARRHLRPVAVALIEVFEGVPGSASLTAPPERAAESIRQTVRDADTACRLADGVYAIILEDTPENGAVWTVERVRRNLVSRFGSHTMWAGVACYPAHAFSTEELVTQARSALESAREWKQDRIEVAIAE